MNAKHTELFNNLGMIESIIGKNETKELLNCVNMHDELIECLKNLVDRNLIKDTDGDHYTEIMELLDKESEA